MPLNLPVCDETLRISLADEAKNSIPIQGRGLGTRPGFEMMAHTAGRGVALFAKGAIDAIPAVNMRSQVLSHKC